MTTTMAQYGIAFCAEKFAPDYKEREKLWLLSKDPIRMRLIGQTVNGL